MIIRGDQNESQVVSEISYLFNSIHLGIGDLEIDLQRYSEMLVGMFSLLGNDFPHGHSSSFGGSPPFFDFKYRTDWIMLLYTHND